MKFKATVMFPGEPGVTIRAELDAIATQCEALNKWPGSIGTTTSRTTLHLFETIADHVAICGSHLGETALHFATAGRKYKVCLKCRKSAEGGE